MYAQIFRFSATLVLCMSVSLCVSIIFVARATIVSDSLDYHDDCYYDYYDDEVNRSKQAKFHQIE